MIKFGSVIILLFLLISCKREIESIGVATENEHANELKEKSRNLTEKQKRISDAALSLVDQMVVYDPTYFTIDYPNGDVPPGKGVCTDVVTEPTVSWEWIYKKKCMKI